MDELSLRAAFEARKASLEAWGWEVCAHVCAALQTHLGVDKRLEYFLKIWPVRPRVKGTNSFVRKALYRRKPYADPLREISDQVGIRFVTLLVAEIATIEQIVLSCPLWAAEKARDFEEERLADPLSFDYQSLHYVATATETHEFQGVEIAVGTMCEVQIRTLLQHAYSELSHDAFYKPTMSGVAENAQLRRQVARSMALIETTDLIFSTVMRSITDFAEELRRPVREAAEVYQREVGLVEPIDFALSDYVLASYLQYLPSVNAERLTAFLRNKAHMKEFIRSRAKENAFFAHPLSLIISLLIEEEPDDISANWPLDPEMLAPIYTQLGIAVPG